MTEIGDILTAWRENRRALALATVVRLDGSGYRRPGARMLVLGDGSVVGAVSGGCIERDVIYRAGAVAADGKPIVVRYDSISEEEAGPGASLGCGGTIDILIEPADADCLSAIQWLRASLRRGVIATVIDGPRIGQRMAMDDSGEVHGESEPAVIEEIRAAMEMGQSRLVRLEVGASAAQLFLEYIEPPLELLIFGAGPDAVPLAGLAKSVGWRVTVVDLRSATASAGRTFDADAQVRCAAGELEKLDVPGACAAVVMNHNWNHDLASLRRMATAGSRYLGILGPRRRTQRMLARLGAAAPAAKDLHYPIGLDIGAESPREVALSIVAEITAVLRGAGGGSLRDKDGPIHTTAMQEQTLSAIEQPISCLSAL